MGFVYRVDATRRVRQSEHGPDAYRSDTKSVTIPFGKGEAIKTGPEALVVATGRAQALVEHASSVSIWRLTNAGNGTGSYIKDDHESRFDVGWEGVKGVRFD